METPNTFNKTVICFIFESGISPRMASNIPDEVMMDAALIKELVEVAKDAALLQGVLMRTKESPNSSEVFF